MVNIDTMSEETDIKSSYLLVSDSNEMGEQFDSKKLEYAELVELAQDALFNKHVPILSQYLTVNQYNTYKNILDQRKKILDTVWSLYKDERQSSKLKVVDG